MLFVPGDSERKLARAMTVGADALILDLEDSVEFTQKEFARQHVSMVLDGSMQGAPRLFVRINPLDAGMIDDDLALIVKPGLDGILLPKVNGAHDVAEVAKMLDYREKAAGVDPGQVKIAVVATETPLAMFNLGSYVPPHPRLIALTWGAEDLAAALGATTNKEDDGGWTSPYVQARTMCLFAAAAAEVAPLDTLYSNFRDSAGLQRDCQRSRRDGFTGRVAIHPDQVSIINKSYEPSEAELAQAHKIVAAFELNPTAGVLAIEGKMYDIPHLKSARKTISSSQI